MIRLQRTGRKKQASFRIVVTDKAESRDGPAIETLGTYNPRTQPSLVKLNTAAALGWLHEGARPTDTVVSIFKKTGVWEKYRQGVTGETLDEADAVVQLGGDRKTSRRAETAAEGEKLAATRRAEEKAAAEAAARKAAQEKAAEQKAAAAAAAAEAAQAEQDQAADQEAAEEETADQEPVGGSAAAEAEEEEDLAEGAAGDEAEAGDAEFEEPSEAEAAAAEPLEAEADVDAEAATDAEVEADEIDK